MADASFPRSRLRKSGWALLYVVGFALAAKFAFYIVFSRFAPYDDEGFILISLKSFFNGNALYDEVYSCYQPFFYIAYWLGFELLNAVPCHDNIRLVTAFLWIACSLANSFLALRITRSGFLGFLVFVVSLHWFIPFANEPGHPQALTYLLVACLLLYWSIANHISPTALAFGLGCFVGLTVLTKINVGALALLPIHFVAFLNCRSGLGTWLRTGAASLMVLFPLVVMRVELAALAQHPTSCCLAILAAGLAVIVLRGFRLISGWPLEFVCLATVFLMLASSSRWIAALLPTFSIAQVLLVLSRQSRDQTPLQFKVIIAALAGLGVTVAGILALTLLRGTSMSGLWHGVFVSPAIQSGAFHMPWTSNPLECFFCIAGLLGAFVFTRCQDSLSANPLAKLVVPWAKLLFGIATLSGIWFSWTEPLQALPQFWMLPLAFLVVIPPAGEQPNTAMRQALLALAIMQPLVAYPIAGTQLSAGLGLIIVVACVCVADAVPFLVRRRAQDPRFAFYSWGAGTIAALALLLNLRLEVSALAARYSSLCPLNLPGASYVRLPQAKATELQSLVNTLSRQDVTTFITLPGLNSLYLWTLKEPPTCLNTTTWMTLLSPKEQERIWQAAQKSPTLLAVRNRWVASFWLQGRSLENAPLARHVDEDFITIAAFGNYEVLARRKQEEHARYDKPN